MYQTCIEVGFSPDEMTFSYVSSYQYKGGDILLSASTTISGSALRNFDSTHKLGNVITQTHDN